MAIGAAGPCDETALSVALRALDTAPDEQVARLTAADLAEACAFDDTIEAALLLSAKGEEPDSDALLAHPAFAALCPDAPRRPAPPALWRRCELARLGAFTREDWLAGTGPPLLALVVHQALVSDGTPPDTAQIVVRRLAGIPRLSRSEVVDVFEPLFPTFP